MHGPVNPPTELTMAGPCFFMPWTLSGPAVAKSPSAAEVDTLLAPIPDIQLLVSALTPAS
jgi:hypothetical protein